METDEIYAKCEGLKMYASKRRQRNFKRVRDSPKALSSTNPSKRHRERLNGELETVAMLLPYDSTTISRLDKLSVLRLAVSFLQCKAHFQACLHNSTYITPGYPLSTHSYCYQPLVPTPFSNKVPTIYDPRMASPLLDPEEANFEEIALKALGGFVIVLNDNGEIYYASENIESFLGFHQSDVLHQPIYDLIHSEDRDDIRQQLDANLHHLSPPTISTAFEMSDDSKNLERTVNARFRCLLDNTCGFLRIDMRGKLMSLHGLPTSYVMGRTSSGPVLGMICICTPFVPPSTSDFASEDLILKTKHQLDGSLVSMDQKVHDMLEIGDSDLPTPFYRLIHVEDAICMAEAHKEVLKNGSSGLLVYRWISAKTQRTYFVQSSCRLFYKNSKPESMGLTHRLLNEVEGMMLLEKRSSLKAKLLSFDDSFLQSPRNLQSTAALPFKDDVSDQQPTTSRKRREPPLPPPPQPVAPPMMFEPFVDYSQPWHHDVYHTHPPPQYFPAAPQAYHPTVALPYPPPMDYRNAMWIPNDPEHSQLNYAPPPPPPQSTIVDPSKDFSSSSSPERPPFNHLMCDLIG